MHEQQDFYVKYGSLSNDPANRKHWKRKKHSDEEDSDGENVNDKKNKVFLKYFYLILSDSC